MKRDINAHFHQWLFILFQQTELIALSLLKSMGKAAKLEKLQNRAARIITGSSWDARSAPILHALKWNSLADRRAKQLKSLMFKTVNHLVPEYLSDKFANVNTIHRHNLRGAQHNLFIPRPNAEALKKSFCYRGAVT